MHSPIKSNVLQYKKLKPGLVTFYDIRPGNRAGLFSKERISKEEITKEKVKKKNKCGSMRYKQANNIYSTEIKNRITGAIRPGARNGAELIRPQFTSLDEYFSYCNMQPT